LEQQEVPGIEALATELGVGRRTLERTFQTTIGISPKRYAGILRTQHFLKALHQPESLTRLAYEFGYYDQSHLIRDFKAKTGITPGKYFAARDALAVNFIQFAG
jgi:AraC-like DNA-binding protein